MSNRSSSSPATGRPSPTISAATKAGPYAKPSAPQARVRCVRPQPNRASPSSSTVAGKRTLEDTRRTIGELDPRLPARIRRHRHRSRRINMHVTNQSPTNTDSRQTDRARGNPRSCSRYAPQIRICAVRPLQRPFWARDQAAKASLVRSCASLMASLASRKRSASSFVIGRPKK
jgi:hypothetical protein